MISEETKEFLNETSLDSLGRALDEVFYSLNCTNKGSIRNLEFNDKGFSLDLISFYGDGDVKECGSYVFTWDEIINIDSFIDTLNKKDKEEKERLDLIDQQNKLKWKKESEEREVKEYNRLREKYGARCDCGELQGTCAGWCK